MTLQDLGSIGELVAALATVVTLAYLALQIRQFSRATRADASRGTVDMDAASLAVAQDPELARIIVSGLSDFSSLGPVERTRFAYTLGTMIGAVARNYDNVTLGIVNEAYFRNRSWGHLMMLETPGGSDFWYAFADTFPPEFREFVTREINLRRRGESADRAAAVQQADEADVE